VGVLLGLLAAVAYGASDFAAGAGGRRASAEAIAILSQPFGLAAAILAVLLVDAHSPTAGSLLWGALAGVGSGVGTLALFRGLTVGRMSVVAPLSAVLSAALPAIVGIATGDSLSPLRLAGLGLALPAVALVSRQAGDAGDDRESGIWEGLVAGAGFAVLFIGLARAGTHAGAWPLVPCQAIAVAAVVVIGLALGRPGGTWRAAWRPAVLTGIGGGSANLLYLAATGHGQLSVVAVVTALYPAVTILLARVVLDERWARVQAVGLGLSALAVGLISLS
jgi:drug/metabolite transporter (DMT)-like permease